MPAWHDVELAAALLAIDPTGLGGAVLHQPSHEAARDWSALVRACMGDGTNHAVPMRRIPAGVTDDRLLGGVDLTATLTAGRLVTERGLLAASDGGVVVVPMAERITASVLAALVQVLDAHSVRVEREGVTAQHDARLALVCLDEGAEDERLPDALIDRLAFRLHGLHVFTHDPQRHAALVSRAAAARQMVASVSDGADWIAAIAQLAVEYGIDSLRAPLFAWRVARAHAALHGRVDVTEEDAAAAVRLVLLPRATRMPMPPQADAREDAEQEDHHEPPSPEPSPPPPPPQDASSPDDAVDTAPHASTHPEMESDVPSDVEHEATRPPADILREAVAASLPPGMLEQLLARVGAASAGQGRMGEETVSYVRGRPRGTRHGEPRGGKRLHLLETLRVAAPWQRARGRHTPHSRVALRKEDFRIRRFVERTGTTVIFVVDASGSAALARLSETKGAIELLLAESYARRDRVSLIAFRGTQADTALPPTRALARARRVLAGVMGGGGTPLATAINAALHAATAAQRGGSSPLVVFLTDGRANIARDGTPGREQAGRDALTSARAYHTARLSTLFVDTSIRPDPATRALAEALGARYMPLPAANSDVLRGVVRATQQGLLGGATR